eukprot:COSAG06_NODE_21655_length_749_cov_13.063077_2_plen_201_part_00
MRGVQRGACGRGHQRGDSVCRLPPGELRSCLRPLLHRLQQRGKLYIYVFIYLYTFIYTYRSCHQLAPFGFRTPVCFISGVFLLVSVLTKTSFGCAVFCAAFCVFCVFCAVFYVVLWRPAVLCSVLCSVCSVLCCVLCSVLCAVCCVLCAVCCAAGVGRERNPGGAPAIRLGPAQRRRRDWVRTEMITAPRNNGRPFLKPK